MISEINHYWQDFSDGINPFDILPESFPAKLKLTIPMYNLCKKQNGGQSGWIECWLQKLSNVPSR
jgi:hypothetical protein